MRDGGVGGCRQATSLENQLQQIADAVPQDVDAQVRDALQRSLDHLFELLARECEGVDQTETETTPTETETVPTETETVPTETVTTPTETTPTETVPTETQPPQTTPDGNSGGGGAGRARGRRMTVPAEVAGRYRIERRLGAGGMSTVFEATDTVLERAVAVKLLAEHLADDEAFVARFRREALAAARLQHPNVVQVFDSGQDLESRRHYIVMEYVNGPSCADLLREHKRLGVEETVAIVRDACHGLDYAHRAGVVHRDVKPGNLLIAEEVNTTKLADFGIAKAAELTRITQVGSVLGTAAYLSPEQAHGEEAGPASDIYSLGVCTYQFLTGRLPHEYTSLTELALKQQQDPITPITELRPEVPPELDQAVRLCLEREAGSRYASALQLAQALDAGLLGQSTDVTRALAAADTDATRAMRSGGHRGHSRPPRAIRADPASAATADSTAVGCPASSRGGAAGPPGRQAPARDLPRASGDHRRDRRGWAGAAGVEAERGSAGGREQRAAADRRDARLHSGALALRLAACSA